jgi:hypothetical protein
MSVKIESADVISRVKNGDILLQSAKEEKFKVTQKGDDFFLLTAADEERAFKMVRFTELIKDNWYLESPFSFT